MFLDGTIYEMLTSKVSVHFSCKGNFCKFFLDLQPKIFKKKDLRSIGATLVTQRSYLASRRFRGVETVLENGPPVDQHTFSSNSICQRMLPVLTFPPCDQQSINNMCSKEYSWPKLAPYSSVYKCTLIKKNIVQHN